MFSTKIKVRLIDGQQPLEIKKKGDWIDLRANQNVDIKCAKSTKQGVTFNSYKIPLGIAMKLPEGYEAWVAPRSSTFVSFGVIQWNSLGIIDNGYSGSNDEWSFGAVGVTNGTINKGDRICQFRIVLNQKATVWQRIKWLLSGGKIKIEYVDKLDDEDRNGFGSTGKN